MWRVVNGSGDQVWLVGGEQPVECLANRGAGFGAGELGK